MVIYLERGADLHMAQLMPLPFTVSCFSEIQIGFICLVPAHPGSPGQKAVKRVCVAGGSELRDHGDTWARFAAIVYDNSSGQFEYNARRWNNVVSSYICQLPQQGRSHR